MPFPRIANVYITNSSLKLRKVKRSVTAVHAAQQSSALGGPAVDFHQSLAVFCTEAGAFHETRTKYGSDRKLFSATLPSDGSMNDLNAVNTYATVS
eukprot:scaffold4588_cov33-Prasinocladus_malaysianus.AAC.1